MGVDLLDVGFRLDRHFGVRLSRAQIAKLAIRRQRPDILVGDLFRKADR